MAKQPQDSKQLKGEVKDAVRGAQSDAKSGNVATVKETSNQPVEDLPTGTRRSHPAE